MTVRSGSERRDFIQQNIGVQNGVCGHVWHANRLESICMAAWVATKQALLRTLLNPSFNQSTQNPSLRWKSRRVRQALHDRGDCYDGKPLRRPGTCWDLIVPISDIRLAVAQQRARAGDELRAGG